MSTSRETRTNHDLSYARTRLVDFFELHSSSRQMPSHADAQKIIAYLENPVSAGLWQLTARWNYDGISKLLGDELEKAFQDKEYISIRSDKRERRIVLSEEKRGEIKRDIGARLTPLLSLFDYLARQQSGDPKKTKSFNPRDEDIQVILDVVDIEVIKNKYSEAIQFFKDEIWFPDFEPLINLRKLNKTKKGTFILSSGPRDDAGIVLTGLEPESLESLQRFLLLVEKVEDPSLMPIFSPEEEVFSPYFDLLGIVYEKLVKQKHLHPMFKKAISNFADSSFTDCVTALGRAAEDLLTQILETLFREPLTKGLTLGQLADDIQARASATIKKKDDLPPDLSPLYAEIKRAIDSQQFQGPQAFEVIRSLLKLTIESNKYINERIDRIGRTEAKGLLFPEFVNHSLSELIRYRNAASHNSKLPIGPFECRRAAHYLVVVIAWWEREKRAINWRSAPEEIVRDCITRNCKKR